MAKAEDDLNSIGIKIIMTAMHFHPENQERHVWYLDILLGRGGCGSIEMGWECHFIENSWSSM